MTFIIAITAVLAVAGLIAAATLAFRAQVAAAETAERLRVLRSLDLASERRT